MTDTTANNTPRSDDGEQSEQARQQAQKDQTNQDRPQTYQRQSGSLGQRTAPPWRMPLFGR